MLVSQATMNLLSQAMNTVSKNLQRQFFKLGSWQLGEWLAGGPHRETAI